MRNAILFGALMASVAISVACGGGGTSNNSSTATNGNSTNTNTDNPLPVKTPTPEQTTNNAPTLTPVFKAFCDAVNKKDDAGLRKVLSSDAMTSIQQQMKQQNIKTLSAYFEDDKYKTTCEVRNEQITGDQAVAEVRGDTYPNGIKMIFVKEGGEWKLTTRSPDIESMKKSNASNSNAAK
jgi:hypothetical protein